MCARTDRTPIQTHPKVRTLERANLRDLQRDRRHGRRAVSSAGGSDAAGAAALQDTIQYPRMNLETASPSRNDMSRTRL